MADRKASETIQYHEALLARDPNSRSFAQLADAYCQQGLVVIDHLRRGSVGHHPPVSEGC